MHPLILRIRADHPHLRVEVDIVDGEHSFLHLAHQVEDICRGRFTIVNDLVGVDIGHAGTANPQAL